MLQFRGEVHESVGYSLAVSKASFAGKCLEEMSELIYGLCGQSLERGRRHDTFLVVCTDLG